MTRYCWCASRDGMAATVCMYGWRGLVVTGATGQSDQGQGRPMAAQTGRNADYSASAQAKSGLRAVGGRLALAVFFPGPGYRHRTHSQVPQPGPGRSGSCQPPRAARPPDDRIPTYDSASTIINRSSCAPSFLSPPHHPPYPNHEPSASTLLPPPARLLLRAQGYNSASFLPWRGLFGWLERRFAASRKPETNCEWHAPRGMLAARLVKGVGQCMIQMRKPITCQSALPFEKLESWAWLGSA